MKPRPLIFSGNANPVLASNVAFCSTNQLADATVQRFSDGEVSVQIDQSVRGLDCFVIQPTCGSPNESLMELLVMIDALKRASAGSIVAVVPYFGYARQDRKSKPRTPITAKLVANLITTAGADRVVAVDLHAAQIQGFFDIPVDHLYARPVLLESLREFDLSGPNVVIVSPDAGGVERARSFSERLGAGLAIVDKRRLRANECEVMSIVGDVREKHAVIVDDMVDTARTLVKAAEAVMAAGARTVSAYATHGVLSGEARQLIQGSCLSSVVVTDTIPQPYTGHDKIVVVSVAPLLGEAIRRIHAGVSVSSLFE